MAKIKTEKVTVIVAPIQGHQHFHFCRTALQSSDKANFKPGTSDAWFRCDMFEPVEVEIKRLLISEGVAKEVIREEFVRQNNQYSFDLRFEYVPVDSDT